MADVSVRPATAGDVAEIARIQADTWRLAYRTVLAPEVLEAITPEAVAPSWQAAIESPPTPDYRVFVAMEGQWRTGFAAVGPDADHQPEDPDEDSTAAVSLLIVEPRWGRRGHGSRLLAAMADTCRAAGRTRLVAWVAAADTASLQFYRGAGWAADGLQRTLETGAGTVTELRLHTALDEG